MQKNIISFVYIQKNKKRKFQRRKKVSKNWQLNIRRTVLPRFER